MIFTCLRFCKENLANFFRSAIYCRPGVFWFFSSAWCVFLVPHLIENKWSSWNMGRTSISASSNSPIIASQVVANLTCKGTAHFCCSFLLQFVGMLYYHPLKIWCSPSILYRPSPPLAETPPWPIFSSSPGPLSLCFPLWSVKPYSLKVLFEATPFYSIFRILTRIFLSGMPPQVHQWPDRISLCAKVYAKD